MTNAEARKMRRLYDALNAKPLDRIAVLRESLAKHIGYSKAVHSRGTELPWCWSDTGEKSNDFAIGTASTADSDNAPMAEGYVDSARMDSMEVIPIDEVCTAENADFADAELIVAAVNAAPELIATIDRLNAQLATARKALEWFADRDARCLHAAQHEGSDYDPTSTFECMMRVALDALAAIDKGADGAETEREE